MRGTGFGRARGGLLLASVVFALLFAGVVSAQEDEDEQELPPPPSIFDFVDYRVEDPEGLIAPEANFQNRWRRIWGALGMRYHLYPSQQTGPDSWPPHMFAGGMNYSIWRNPITGWPEF